MANGHVSPFATLLQELGLCGSNVILVSDLSGRALTIAASTRGEAASTDASLRSFTADHGARRLPIGPETWMIIGPHFSDDWQGELERSVGTVATLFDQTFAYGVLQLNGQDALSLLQKGLFIDLAEALRNDGDCVCGLIGHVNVTVWRAMHDEFGVAVARSYAASFWHWLITSASASGMELVRAV